MEREPNTIYTLSLSYGKDSLACLGAIEQLGLPLDRIVHAEVWATETIPADLPPMVEFKKKADAIIKERYGIEVEHVFATKKNGGGYSLTCKCLTQQQIHKNTGNISTDSQSNLAVGVQANSNKKYLPKLTYEDIFSRTLKPRGGGVRTSYGFPMRRGQWCNNLLKVNAIDYGVRKPLGAVLHRRTQTSGDTDFRGITKWEEVNGV